tara:strand:+ start:839 stop:1609 length:771 start_codon:yes stop_codon:yes gene_type:complete
MISTGFIDLSLDSINSYEKLYELAVVIPVYNESENIEQVLTEWDIKFKSLKINYCFIIINDGSTDSSLAKLHNATFPKFIINKNNSGHGRSLRFGYDFALKKIKVDYIFQIDSDGQCMPKFFDRFWQERNDFDFLIGQRTKRGDGIIRLIISKISTILSSLVLGINIHDANTPYRLFTKKCLSEIVNEVYESFDLQNIAITYIAYKKQHKILRIPIEFADRTAGNTIFSGSSNNINLLKVFKIGMGMLIDLIYLRK